MAKKKNSARSKGGSKYQSASRRSGSGAGRRQAAEKRSALERAKHLGGDGYYTTKGRKISFFILGVLAVALVVRFGTFGVQALGVPTVKGDGIPYIIRGVDVSKYQGDIDWDVLASQDIAFAYIKATEGTDIVDRNFEYNWENAKKTKLRIGAYHFFRFDEDGDAQGRHFADTVDPVSRMLPPVLDIELYGKYETHEPTVEEVDAVLEPCLDRMRRAYGVEPVIYTSRYFYETYIRGKYDNPIWIADHQMRDTLPDGEDWAFCQYTYEGQMDGYSGDSKYIDLDVFHGGRWKFVRF